MKKHKICKILLVILAIFLCVAFYELLGICVAYKKQPEVSNTTKKRNKKWVMERMKWKYRTGSNHRKESRSTFTKSAFDQECKKGNYSFYFCISIRWKWKIDFRSTAWCGRQRRTYSSVSRWNEELDWYERVSRQVLEDGTYRDPYHVEPIELTKKRQRKIFLVQHLLGWARYLF